MVSAPPPLPHPHFLHLWGINLYWGVIIMWGERYFISLETSNTQKSKVFHLRIFSGNVNASGVVTCQNPQIYLKSP